MLPRRTPTVKLPSVPAVATREPNAPARASQAESAAPSTTTPEVLAEQAAAASVVETSVAPVKRPRGRPRKDGTVRVIAPEADAALASQVPTSTSDAGLETPVKRKRGRPKKDSLISTAQDVSVPIGEDVAAVSEATNMPPPLTSSGPSSATAEPPRKRGRPPKLKPGVAGTIAQQSQPVQDSDMQVDASTESEPHPLVTASAPAVNESTEASHTTGQVTESETAAADADESTVGVEMQPTMQDLTAASELVQNESSVQQHGGPIDNVVMEEADAIANAAQADVSRKRKRGRPRKGEERPTTKTTKTIKARKAPVAAKPAEQTQDMTENATGTGDSGAATQDAGPVEGDVTIVSDHEELNQGSDADFVDDEAQSKMPVVRKRGRPRKGEERQKKAPKKATVRSRPASAPATAPKQKADAVSMRIQKMLQDPKFRPRIKDASKLEMMLSTLGSHHNHDELLEMRARQGYALPAPNRQVIRSLGKLPTPRPSPNFSNASAQILEETDAASIKDYLPPSTRQTLFFVSNKATLINPSQVELRSGQAHNLDDQDPLSTSSTINTGLINRAVAWMPNLKHEQILAVGGGLPSQMPCPQYRYKQEPGCIQLWRAKRNGKATDCHLDSVVVHDFGICWDLKWIPLVIEHDRYQGVLAACVGTGQVIVIFVEKHNETETVYFKLKIPALILSLQDHFITCFDWHDADSIVVGCDDGTIAHFDLLRAAHPTLGLLPKQVVHPQVCYIAHIVSCQPGMPNVVATNSFDCEISLTDLSGTCGAGSSTARLSRFRSVSYAFAWCNMTGCLVSNDESGMSLRFSSTRLGMSTSLQDRLPGLVTSVACVKPLLNDADDTLPGVAEGASHPIAAVGDASGQVWLYNVHNKMQVKKGAQNKQLVCSAQYLADLKPEVAQAWHNGEKIEDLLQPTQPGAMLIVEGLPAVEFQKKVANKAGGNSDDDDDDETGNAAPAKKPRGRPKGKAKAAIAVDDDDEDGEAASAPALAKRAEQTKGKSQPPVDNDDEGEADEQDAPPPKKPTAKTKAKGKRKAAIAADDDDRVDEADTPARKGKGRGKLATADDDDDDDFMEDDGPAKKKSKSKAKGTGKAAQEGDGRMNSGTARDGYGRHVYHEEVMVRALAWNPNLITELNGEPSAAWSGMLATAYSSFVRIEDMGVN